MSKKRSVFHLCQYNIGRAIADLDDPVMAGFVGGQDQLYALAETSPGYIWRLQPEEGEGSVLPFPDDPRMVVGLTVWEDLETLKNYVYKNDHAEYLRKRRQWFEKLEGPTAVLWWMPAGEFPTVAEGQRRLERLAAQGPTRAAFTFQSPFPPPAGLIGTLGPERTNSEKGADEFMSREKLADQELRLYPTFEDVADRVIDGTLECGVICTAYLKFSALYFERAPKLRITDAFVSDLHPMVIASQPGKSLTGRLRLACQPAILPLLNRFLGDTEVRPAASNASAALDVVAGEADVCLTTEAAALAASLKILIRMPPLQIPFAIFERSGDDGKMPAEIAQLFNSEHPHGLQVKEIEETDHLQPSAVPATELTEVR
jgi:uncharacterized protein DUF3291